MNLGARASGSRRFSRVEPHRTHVKLLRRRGSLSSEELNHHGVYRVVVLWFWMVRPHRATDSIGILCVLSPLQGIEGVQGAICTSLMRFKHIEPHRTFSNE